MGMTAGAGATAPSSAPAARRRVRNYLLDTSLQLRLSSYLLAASAAVAALLGWLLWRSYREASKIVALTDPDVGQSIASALAPEDRARMLWVAALLVAVLVVLLCAAVVITHRIAGPAYVIGRACRHVTDGRLERLRPLRSRDLLVDLAEDVAGMVEALREREEAERAAIAAAASRLRDAAASAADRAEAAAVLERIAAEKAKRLET
jgi:methyl-accepting chemotaxis protein